MQTAAQIDMQFKRQSRMSLRNHYQLGVEIGIIWQIWLNRPLVKCGPSTD